jgi:hypothetical protein
MAVCSVLNGIKDERHGGEDCLFHGYLEDYLSLPDTGLKDPEREAFTEIVKQDPEVKIAAGCRGRISRNAISNQIIRYRDVFKLGGKPLLYPYILYEDRDGQERALLILPYEEGSYLYAKGCYYCMSEQGADFEPARNEIVALSSPSASLIEDTWNQIFTMNAGALQRKLDRRSFRDYEELFEQAKTCGKNLIANAKQTLPQTGERTAVIHSYVVKWFLLKKVLYVQYMKDRKILDTVHAGNIHKQRNQAKINAENITFISYAELWRMGRKSNNS